MTTQDRKEFNRVLVAVAEIFDKQLSEIQLSLYFEALKDLSFEEVKRAANIVARTCKFFPKPVEFREQILPDLSTKASLAYDKVAGAFFRAGVYESVQFDDLVIHAVINSLGGWVKYCNLSDEEVKWWRKDFERLYQQYAPQIRNLNVPLRLPGIHETENQSKGYPVKPALMMGDAQKILAWTGEVKALKGNNSEPIKALAEKIGSP